MKRVIAIAALMVLGSTMPVAAQTATSELTPLPTPPEPIPVQVSASPFASGNLSTVAGSGTVADRALKRAAFESSGEQIRFDVRVLRVDFEVRDAIYNQIAGSDVNTEITQIESPNVPKADSASLASVHRIATGSIVTTAVMSTPEVRQLLTLVSENPESAVTARPTIIVAEGQVGAIQQQVQRSFLSKLEEVEVGEFVEQAAVRSDIHVLNEGFDFAVQADTDGEAIHVRTKLQHSRVVDVKQHHVYGIGKGRKTVQVPSHEVRIAAASQKLQPGQSLLLDPYLETEKTTTKPSTTPVIGQFLPPSKPTVKRYNTLVLLTASKVKPVQQTSSKSGPPAPQN